jgi:hypothetical protein
MKNVAEFVGNDQTAVFYCKLPENGNQIFWGNVTRESRDKTDIAIFISPYLSFGDYDNSCDVERSNVRVFKGMFADTKNTDWFEIYGGYGSEGIAIPLSCENEEILDILESLEYSPCINDEDVSSLQIEMENEDWYNWIRRDFTDAIMKKFGLLDIDPDKNKLFEYYLQLKDENNLYYEVQMGGNGYIDVNQLVESIEVLPDWMNPEYFD